MKSNSQKHQQKLSNTSKSSNSNLLTCKETVLQAEVSSAHVVATNFTVTQTPRTDGTLTLLLSSLKLCSLMMRFSTSGSATSSIRLIATSTVLLHARFRLET